MLSTSRWLSNSPTFVERESTTLILVQVSSLPSHIARPHIFLQDVQIFATFTEEEGCIVIARATWRQKGQHTPRVQREVGSGRAPGLAPRIIDGTLKHLSEANGLCWPYMRKGSHTGAQETVSKVVVVDFELLTTPAYLESAFGDFGSAVFHVE